MQIIRFGRSVVNIFGLNKNLNMSQDHYIHGYSEDEQKRLSTLNDLLNARCLTKLQVRENQHVLDVGCGLGQLTAQVAQLVKPTGRAVGVEIDVRQLSKAREQVIQNDLVEFRQGSAYNLPLTDLEWGSFDLIYTRFLLEHVKHPDQVVNQMVAAAKTNGRIVLMDDDHAQFQLYPAVPGFGQLWTAYCRSYDRIGNDPFVGRRLVHLLHEAGLDKVHNDYIFFGCTYADPLFGSFVDNIIGILEGSKELILEHKLIDKRSFLLGIENFDQWKTLPGAAIWYAMNVAEGQKT